MAGIFNLSQTAFRVTSISQQMPISKAIARHDFSANDTEANSPNNEADPSP